MREMKKRMKGLLALVLVFALAMNTSGILVKAGDNTLGYTGVLSTTIMQNVGDEVSGDSGGAFRIVDGQEYIDNGNFTVSGSETVYSARDTGTYVGDPTSYPSTATEKVPAEKAYTTLTLSDMTGYRYFIVTGRTDTTSYNSHSDKWGYVSNLSIVGHPNEYTLSYKMNDAELLNETVSYKPEGISLYGADKTEIAAVIPQGYHLTGWNVDGLIVAPAGTLNVSSYAHGDVITASAVTEGNKFILHYNLNGGTASNTEKVSDVEMTNDGTDVSVSLVSEAIAGLQKDKNTFLGWSESEDGSTGIITEVTPDFSKEKTEKTVYAIWEPYPYQVVYHANGGSGTMENQDATVGVSFALSKNKFTKEFSTFLGWAESAASEEASYTDGQVVDFDITEKDAKKDLYAVWTLNTYSVTFNGNGGTGTMETMNGVSGTPITLNTNTFKKEGCTFLGWATTNTATEREYTDGMTFTYNANTYDEVVTLYAVWKTNTYTVAFDSNGGSGTMTNQSGLSKVVMTLLQNSFQKANYTFAGWALTATGSVLYADKADFSHVANTDGETVTLYAVWEEEPTTEEPTTEEPTTEEPTTEEPTTEEPTTEEPTTQEPAVFHMPATPFTIRGEKGTNNYYNTQVVIVPADGYLICDTQNGTFKEMLTLEDTIENESIYLYEKANGMKSEAISLPNLLIDKTVPLVTNVLSDQTYYGEEREVIITDKNLDTVVVNGEKVDFSGDSVTLSLSSKGGLEEYEVTVFDKAGNSYTVTFTLAADWMKDKIIPMNQAVNLKKNNEYKFDSGIWKVSGDKTEYIGGSSFYIRQDGEYTFSKK